MVLGAELLYLVQVRMLHNNNKSPIIHCRPMRVLILLLSTNESRTRLHLCVVGLLHHVVVVVALPQAGQGGTQRLSRFRHQFPVTLENAVIMHFMEVAMTVVIKVWWYC